MHSDGTLASSTFAYRLGQIEQDFHEGLSRKAMMSVWNKTDDGRPFFITATVSSEPAIPLASTGINRPIELVLSEASAIPAQECWAVPIPFMLPVGVPFWSLAPVCYIRTEKSTKHIDMGRNIELDVFPPTLSEFYGLTKKGGGEGYALAWGQDGDLTFPVLKDADGDGLLSKAHGGSDPNDSLWDTDNDGLSDLFEYQVGSNPIADDSDGDGLSDREEVRLGTDPRRVDTDSDGLLDSEEVFHQDDNGNWVGGWEFVYALTANGSPLTTWVWSDPLDPDGDGDMLTDFQEKTFGFNPGVKSDPTVLVFESELSKRVADDEYVYVMPGDTLNYTATLHNKLLSRYAQGLLRTEVPDSMTSDVIPKTFVLHPTQKREMTGSIDVNAGVPSQTAAVTQVAGALITDWRAESGGADLWLRFEGNLNDSSGRQPLRFNSCLGGNCPSYGTGYIGQAAEFDGQDDCVSIGHPDNMAYSDYVTIAAWVNPAGPSTRNRTVLDGRKEYRVWLDTDQTIWWGFHTAGSEWEAHKTDLVVPQGAWTHIAIVFSGGKVNTYVNGVWGDETSTDGFTIRNLKFPRVSVGCVDWFYAQTHPDQFFKGQIDDLRVFPRALSPEEIVALYGQPVMDLRFESIDLDTVYDSSSFGNHVSFLNTRFPGRVDGISGRGAQFSRAQHLYSPTDSVSLDLSDGQYTQSLWIYPNKPAPMDSYWNDWQGVIGRQAGEPDGYPSIMLSHGAGSGTRIKVGFGDGTAFREYQPSLAPLTWNAWNHVAVTYETFDSDGDGLDDAGRFTVYVNGAKVEEPPAYSAYKPSAVGQVEIGRSSSLGSIYIDYIYISDNGDGNYNGEMCMTWNGEEIWNRGGIEQGIYYPSKFIFSIAFSV